MGGHMGGLAKDCAHLEGLKVLVGSEFQCPACRERLDLAGLERWVRDAEVARDEAYSAVEGEEEFVELLCAERQREVYRRRRVLYELRNLPRGVVARPEMILISYDAGDDAYECRIFYKAPHPAYGIERISVRAELDPILALRSHRDPNIRLASSKVAEFHALRGQISREDEHPPLRRVYYSNEL